MMIINVSDISAPEYRTAVSSHQLLTFTCPAFKPIESRDNLALVCVCLVTRGRAVQGGGESSGWRVVQGRVGQGGDPGESSCYRSYLIVRISSVRTLYPPMQQHCRPNPITDVNCSFRTGGAFIIMTSIHAKLLICWDVTHQPTLQIRSFSATSIHRAHCVLCIDRLNKQTIGKQKY